MKGIETSAAHARHTADAAGSDHCPAMKGIETTNDPICFVFLLRSDHCPAMKGIETSSIAESPTTMTERSDHCPAMKGIETKKVPGCESQLL